jgi:lysophospholipase L1-like esterase
MDEVLFRCGARQANVRSPNVTSIVLFVSGLLVCLYLFTAAAAAADAQELPIDNRQPDTGKKILIVGASYAKHWGIGEISGYQVINRGVSGSETGPVLERLETDISEVKPDMVVVWGFINDIFRSQPDVLDQKIAKTKENIRTIIEVCNKNNITPVMATEVTITSKKSWLDSIKSMIGKMLGKKSYADYINKHVSETNRWLRDYAGDKGITVLDFERVLADENGERKTQYAVEDGSHLSKQAYDALTGYMQTVEL